MSADDEGATIAVVKVAAREMAVSNAVDFFIEVPFVLQCCDGLVDLKLRFIGPAQILFPVMPVY